MHKVVFDSNIYISAIVYGGKPEDLVRLCYGRNQKINLFCSPLVIKETADVLASEKFGWMEPRIAKAIRYIARIAEIIVPKSKLSITVHEADNRILECAIEAKADYIVTGDKHLLDLKSYEDIKILKPAKMLELIEKEQ